MSTEELTQKISHLTEDERIAISRQVDEMLMDRDAQKYFKPYTKKDFIALLKKSRAEAARGEVITHQQLLAHIREKYGISA